MKEKKQTKSTREKKAMAKIGDKKKLEEFIERVFKEDDNLLRRLAQ